MLQQTFSNPFWSLTKVDSMFGRTDKHSRDKALAPSPNCSFFGGLIERFKEEGKQIEDEHD